MSRMFHLHLSVRGVLNSSRAELRRYMQTVTKPGGEPFATPEEFSAAFMDLLSEGIEALDISNGGCDNFDPKTGCRGHQVQKGTDAHQPHQPVHGERAS